MIGFFRNFDEPIITRSRSRKNLAPQIREECGVL